MARKAQRELDICFLRALVTTCQQDDEFTTAHSEINPVAGAVINAQLGDAFPDGPDIAGISGGQSFDARQNARACA